jgi:hypothetical protein
LGEVLNVGVVFYFHNDNVCRFVHGPGTRASRVYPDFDHQLYNSLIKSVSTRVQKSANLFLRANGLTHFKNILENDILASDAGGLIFSEPATLRDVTGDQESILNQFSKLLLPGIDVSHPAEQRHTEKFIITRFKKYLPLVEHRLDRNIERKGKRNTKLTFEYGWKSNVYHLIKPLSFDLHEPTAIQNKALLFSGFASQLAETAEVEPAVFDFLVARPQEAQLQPAYEDAIGILQDTKGVSLDIVEENRWASYAAEIRSVVNI